MSETLIAIGGLLFVIGCLFGIVALATHLPDLSLWALNFLTYDWWAIIIIGIITIFVGAWLEE